MPPVPSTRPWTHSGLSPTQSRSRVVRAMVVLPTQPFQVSLPGGSDSKESTCNSGDPDLIPGWGRSPGEGNDYPFQYSCLGNSMDRGVWHATVHGVAKVSHYCAASTLLHVHGKNQYVSCISQKILHFRERQHPHLHILSINLQHL